MSATQTLTQRPARPGRSGWGQRLGGLVILAMVLAETLGLMPWPLLERLEWQAYDLRVLHTLSGEQDPALTLLAIDERSLQALGQWPWPRERLGELVETLFDDYDVAMLGVDAVFAEPEAWSNGEGDRRLAEALAGYPVVLGYYFQQGGFQQGGFEQGGLMSPGSEGTLASVGRLPPPVEVAGDGDLPVPTPSRFTANLPALQQAALGGGYFDNPRVDADGVFRRVPMLQRWGDDYHAALPLAMLRALLGNPEVVPSVGVGAGVRQLEALDVGGYQIPVDGQGAALVPWYGPRGHFASVSAADVLAGRVDAEALAGAIVVLGATAPGLMDLRSTPVGAVYPGAEINLSLLAGMLHQSFRAEPPWVAGAELVALVGLGLATLLLFPLLNAPLLAGLSLLPPALVDDMVRQGGRFGLDGEERELTVLFSDVRNFTAFAESMPPGELTAVMNRLLSPLTRAIHEHGGTIDKYMGDAIMAFWGAPLEDEQHAEHALAGALAMGEALAALNREFSAEGKPRLAMGLGLNSGPMSVGNMGSSFRMAYTVMGDNVNLGSRLEGLTRVYGVAVIVSQATAERAPGWAFRRLDYVLVKGRETPLWILEPLGRRAALPPDQRAWLAAWEAAMARYQRGDFAGADAAFQALEPQRDPVAALYLARLARLRRAPPADWDGVWRHTEK